ncbi:MAG TPA: carbohydrate porin [Phycisphaerae bacterium]|nr:carbohydrate porin [Phycisphaerae bacterium]
MPSIIQTLPDYTGDLAHRKYLTGDWGGARTQLAEKGILFELDVTQILQGNAHGGRDTNNAFRYSGSADYYLKLDTARMGLWPGGLLALHGETKIGDNVNPKVGSLMPPDYQGLLPVPGDPGTTTLSEFYFTQALSEQFVIVAGKIDGTVLADQNAFASNHRTQFMNAGLRINPVLFYGVPYTTMVAGAVWLPTKWLQVVTAVADNDPDGAATMTGFNTAFHGRDWYTATQEYDFTWKPFGKTGHQRLGWFWTSRDFAELSGDGRIQFPQVIGPRALPRQQLPRRARGLRLGNQMYSPAQPETSADTWGIYYNFDQYLFTEADDPEQGIGVFGRFGYGAEPNVFEQFYSLGVGGKGSIPTRDRDTWGIGYYHANISDRIMPEFGLHSEQGVEAYYNIEITPWCHISPDLQVIVDPGGASGPDVAVVYGLRMQMTF